jgi:hypothetical protein
MAVLALMPMASVQMTTDVKTGVFNNIRSA